MVLLRCVPAVLVLLAVAPSGAGGETLAEKYQGQKVLVRFAGTEKDAEDALKEAKVVVVEKTAARTYLLDCGAEKPHDVVGRLPKHQGAIVFQDGAFKEAIGYTTRRGEKLVPKAYACLRWGSSAKAIEQMKEDVERCSKLPGVAAEKINLRPGEKVYGNPWILKLTPTGKTTLLEVFVLGKAGFDYRPESETGK